MTHRRPERATFEAPELAIVLSRWDVGSIGAVQALARGSERSPKAIIATERGAALLKRRGPADSDAAQASFCGRVQAALNRAGYPSAPILATKDGGYVAVIEGRVYQLYGFVRAEGHDHSVAQTRSAGAALADLHALLAGLGAEGEAPGDGFHHAEGLIQRLDAIAGQHKSGARGGEDAMIARMVSALRESYTNASEEAARRGVAAWPAQLIHGDWHPGNMVFQGREVAAVVDFDSIRRGPRAMDLASGALHFSIKKGDDNPDSWPAEADLDRFGAFLEGYDSRPGCRISTAELETLPALMIEALIVEAAGPIAASGSFAGREAGPILKMAERKCRWLREQAERLARALV